LEVSGEHQFAATLESQEKQLGQNIAFRRKKAYFIRTVAMIQPNRNLPSGDDLPARSRRYSRLETCATIVLGLALFILGGSALGAESYPHRFKASPEQAADLQKLIEPWHSQFDAQTNMLRMPFQSPGYHTTLKGGVVHSTRESLTYAVALLDTGDPRWVPQAEAILEKVISLQDQNPESRTYGTWPWFLEEPLARMSPPDMNWADFCGSALLQVAIDHRDRLRPEVAAKVDQAIRHAARSIQRRNVEPSETSIAILGSYVTMVAAELYDLADLRDYAYQNWRRFCDYTRTMDGFAEYNSPTYTIIDLKELGRMQIHVRDAEMRGLAAEVYRRAWKEIATHFHAPTRQWAGPHSRCYDTLLSRETLALIQRGTEGRVSFGPPRHSLDEGRLPLPCPRELEPYFTALSAPREVRQTFIPGAAPVVGVTWLDPAYTLGSVNRGDLWSQSRPLIAYWGNAEHPAYLRLRLLHDGHDFADAQFFSVQNQGSVLAAINFATDGGDRHVSLDPIRNATFSAAELRLRFEFGGDARAAKIELPFTQTNRFSLRFGKLRVEAGVPIAVLDGLVNDWQTITSGTSTSADYLLYAGQKREFKLAEIQAMAAGLYVNFSTTDSEAPKVTAKVADGRLQMKQGGMELAVPVKPGKKSELWRGMTCSGAEKDNSRQKHLETEK
jgi:hypothetical protein